jgi:hypothetical protein
MKNSKKELLKLFWNEFKFVIGIVVGIIMTNFIYVISILITFYATNGGCLK